MGGTPCASFERETLRNELKELDQELERLKNQLDSPAKSSLMGKVRMKISVAEHKLSHLDEDAKEEQEEENNSRMEFGVAYAGTEIRFGDAFLRLRQESRHCTAKLVCDEIVLI